MQRQRKRETDLLTRANKCLITRTRGSEGATQSPLSLHLARLIFFFNRTLSQFADSAALVSSHCCACGIPSGLMREQRGSLQRRRKIRSSVRAAALFIPIARSRCPAPIPILISHCCPRARSAWSRRDESSWRFARLSKLY